MAKCSTCHAEKGLIGGCPNPECPSKHRTKRIRRTDEISGTDLSYKARDARAAAKKRRGEKKKRK